MSACAEAPLRRRRRALGARGISTAEFAVVAGLVATVLIGSVELARYMAVVQSVRVATSEAVRLATLRGSENLNAGHAGCLGLAGTLSGAATPARLLDAALLSVTVTGCATEAGITTASISVQYPFSFVTPFVGVGSQTITETAQAVFH